MGLLIRKNYDDDNNNSSSIISSNPSPTRLSGSGGSGSSFEDYLKAQNKRNTRQALCYFRRYHDVLQTGDATAVASIQSGSVRRHIMEALTSYSKYLGCYDRWCQIRKSYSLHWTNGDESLQSLQRFFDDKLTLDSMLQRIKEMIRVLPEHMALIIRHAVLTGLRPSESVESVRLLNTLSSKEEKAYYYNPERQTLEHFRFPEIFLRRTKKAYISYLSLDNYERIAQIGCKTPTWNAIRRACQRRDIKMEMHLCRRVFASWLRKDGVQPEVVDLLQGRVTQSVLTRHYLTPSYDLKDRILSSLDRLKQEIEK